MEDLPHLLNRSAAFAAHLGNLVAEIRFINPSPRTAACAAAADLSMEHAHAVRTLVSARTGNSACALLRTQYEALVRSGWAMYAATDGQVEKLNLPISHESQQAAKNLPGAQEMLEALKKKMAAEPALAGLVVPLTQIHEVSWRPLNSFVHGGLHPLQRTNGGFPVQLAKDVLRNSNGMLHMAHRMLARLGASLEVVAAVEHCYVGYEDCVPMGRRWIEVAPNRSAPAFEDSAEADVSTNRPTGIFVGTGAVGRLLTFTTAGPGGRKVLPSNV
ncbi:DUF6988 family protein [Quisquiliibacterium transsilvanicum]|uniref:Uncharacterized protein n=1 Tax=Quisquiliibacterium transsilvanicum TaxID=1549638 RepID=A0A7W8HHF5_9BURK|nr:hypothetical protein [Quisquiliibacterium transsilvanicum]MBB5271305.1 hypothetical protein [Quisquiliibacterium transsilvanicum]